MNTISPSSHIRNRILSKVKKVDQVTELKLEQKFSPLFWPVHAHESALIVTEGAKAINIPGCRNSGVGIREEAEASAQRAQSP